MATELELIVDEAGTVSGIYSDALLPYFEAAGVTSLVTRRASDVEPNEEGAGWVAGIRPWVPGGAVNLGPFPTRAEALAAEVLHLGRVL